MQHLRSALITVIVALALALGVSISVAPAQQLPSQPHGPGSGEPSATPGTPAPAAFPSLLPAPTPTASPTAGTAPVPAVSALAPALPDAGAPVPSPLVVRFTGELLDVRNGYVYFTTADAFKLRVDAHIVDLDTGGPTKLIPAPRIYARATIDPASGAVVELALTKRKLPTDEASLQAYQVAHAYVVRTSRTIPAPEINRGPRLTGRPVAVTFVVQVPPTTPLSDSVFMTTDASGWVANAMKMDRIDALHYRLTRNYASGTQFAYRFTRGSWQSVEVGEDGLEADPHDFAVPEVDAVSRKNTVYRWSDQNPSEPNIGPNTIPTPFNPNPFGGFPNGNAHPGVPQPSPTPRP